MLVYNNSLLKWGADLPIENYLDGGKLVANTWVRGYVDLSTFPNTTYDGILFAGQTSATGLATMYLDDIFF